MNRLDSSIRAQIIAALVEGASIRAITRMVGISKNTVAKLLLEVGAACAVYQDKALRNLPCKRIQCDEIWSFVGAKDKNLPADKQRQFGFGERVDLHGSGWGYELDCLLDGRRTRCNRGA